MNFVVYLCMSIILKKSSTIENNFFTLPTSPGIPTPQRQRLLPRPVILWAINLQNVNSQFVFFIHNEIDTMLLTWYVQFRSKLNIKFVTYVPFHMPAGQLIYISRLGIQEGKALS